MCNNNETVCRDRFVRKRLEATSQLNSHHKLNIQNNVNNTQHSVNNSQHTQFTTQRTQFTTQHTQFIT